MEVRSDNFGNITRTLRNDPGRQSRSFKVTQPARERDPSQPAAPAAARVGNAAATGIRDGLAAPMGKREIMTAHTTNAAARR